MNKTLPIGKKLLLLLSFLFAGQLFSQQMPLLDPVSHPKFVNELPVPGVLQPFDENSYKVYIMETSQDLLGLKNSVGEPLYMTTVWGYGHDPNDLTSITYPGPTIEAQVYQPITVQWINKLPTGDVFANHLFAIDPTLHWAGSYKNLSGIPTVTHLHGGHTEAKSDGNPQAWYTPGSSGEKGELFDDNGDLYTYANDQEATTLWYHDHTLGITRLNVYAGLAGFYMLRDPNSEIESKLPAGDYEIPLVIQDRSFDVHGQLHYPSDPLLLETPLTGDYPSSLNTTTVLPEMFGDFILVNGKTWPIKNVEPTKYRLRLLNGSDSRFYELNLPGVTFTQIGSDGGFLVNKVVTNKLLIGPGERLDVIVDFSAPELAGQTLIMKNTARSPYPFGATVNPQTTGRIMAFKVQFPDADTPIAAAIPTNLRSGLPVLGPTTNIRELVLFEGMDDYGRLKPQLGTAAGGPMDYMDEITENPKSGAVEEWKIFNTTADAHPVHLHLVHFQVQDIQKFNVKKSVFGNDPEKPVKPVIQLIGNPKPPSPENAGLKDTFIILPGEMARVKAHFDLDGMYVWHCHILSHEDYDMMRPLYVGNEIPEKYQVMFNTVETAMVDAGLTLNSIEGIITAPNPFQQTIQVSFSLAADLDVNLSVYNMMGQEVARIYSGPAIAYQPYEFTFDRQNLPAGSYICKLVTSDGRSFEQVIIAQ